MQVARSDLFSTKDGIRKPVFALRMENIPERVTLSFTKKEFVDAVVFGKLGVANKAKTIGNSHRKATLVFMTRLPPEIQELLVKGIT